MRFFNTAGPVDCERHYCLPPLERLDLTRVIRLIEQQKYFVLHAPRQTGKTSALLALMAHLNQSRPFIFDRREGKSWEERLFERQESFQGKPIAVWGM